MNEVPAKPIESGTIGSNVRTLREMKGLSQGQLAKAAGCHQPDVSDLEHGRHEPTISFLRRIAAALGVNLSVLMSENG
jgi:XRE family transcriptional regulator, regulator of sulfur utilization